MFEEHSSEIPSRKVVLPEKKLSAESSSISRTISKVPATVAAKTVHKAPEHSALATEQEEVIYNILHSANSKEKKAAQSKPTVLEPSRNYHVLEEDEEEFESTSSKKGDEDDRLEDSAASMSQEINHVTSFENHELVSRDSFPDSSESDGAHVKNDRESIAPPEMVDEYSGNFNNNEDSIAADPSKVAKYETKAKVSEVHPTIDTSVSDADIIPEDWKLSKNIASYESPTVDSDDRAPFASIPSLFGYDLEKSLDGIDRRHLTSGKVPASSHPSVSVSHHVQNVPTGRKSVPIGSHTVAVHHREPSNQTPSHHSASNNKATPIEPSDDEEPEAAKPHLTAKATARNEAIHKRLLSRTHTRTAAAVKETHPVTPQHGSSIEKKKNVPSRHAYPEVGDVASQPEGTSERPNADSNGTGDAGSVGAAEAAGNRVDSGAADGAEDSKTLFESLFE